MGKNSEKNEELKIGCNPIFKRRSQQRAPDGPGTRFVNLFQVSAVSLITTQPQTVSDVRKF
jgi:hypothetical protein